MADRDSLSVLNEKLHELTELFLVSKTQFDNARERKDVEHRQLLEIKQNHENITKKIEDKKHSIVLIMEKIVDEQAKRHEIQQRIPQLTNKSCQFNDDIHRYHDRLTELLRCQPKVYS
jgi:peptidoglycan hydrolase CwlO-like protein